MYGSWPKCPDGFFNNSTILYTMVWEFPSREMGITTVYNYIAVYNCIQRLYTIIYTGRKMRVFRPENASFPAG